MTFNKKDIIEAVRQLKAIAVPELSMPMLDDVRLTVNGVVQIGDRGYAHPETFRQMCGEAAYQELLKRPRVVSEYD